MLNISEGDVVVYLLYDVRPISLNSAFYNEK